MQYIPDEIEVLERLEAIERILHLVALAWITKREAAAGELLAKGSVELTEAIEMLRLILDTNLESIFKDETFH